MSKARKSELGSKLAKLALVVTDQALGEDITLEDRLEALKIAGTYYLGVTKVKAKDKEDDPETPTFGKFRELINGTKSAEREN